MKKHELLAALAGLDDDIELWMEIDAGIAPLGHAYYQATYPDDEKDEPIVLLAPLVTPNA